MQRSPELAPCPKLTSVQATLISLCVAGGLAAVLLVIGIGYRDTSLGRYTLGGIAALALALAIFARPRIGAYILTITVFTNLSSIFTDAGLPSLNKPLVILVFVSILANRLWRKAEPLKLKRTEWFMLAYGCVWLLSAFVARDRVEAIDQTIDFFKDSAILLCVMVALDTRQAWRRTAWLLILSMSIPAALGVYQTVSGNFSQTFGGLAQIKLDQVVTDQVQARLSGPVGDPNFYGQILVAVLPVALYRVLDERRLALKLVALVATILLTLALLNTYSRGAFLALVVILLLITAERRVKLPLIGFVAVLGFILARLLPAGYTDRLQTLLLLSPGGESGVYEDVSFRGRSAELQAGLDMFAEHPFLGVGIGNYSILYQDYAGRFGLEQRTTERDVHSLYVEVLAETGLAGAFAFVGLFGSLLFGLYQAQRKRRASRLDARWPGWLVAIQMSIVAYLISSIFLHNDFIRYLWMLVSMGVAAIHVSEVQAVRAPPPSPLQVTTP